MGSGPQPPILTHRTRTPLPPPLAHTHTHTRKHARTHTHTHTHTHEHTHTHAHTHTCTLTQSHTHARTHARTHTHTSCTLCSVERAVNRIAVDPSLAHPPSPHPSAPGASTNSSAGVFVGTFKGRLGVPRPRRRASYHKPARAQPAQPTQHTARSASAAAHTPVAAPAADPATPHSGQPQADPASVHSRQPQAQAQPPPSGCENGTGVLPAEGPEQKAAEQQQQQQEQLLFLEQVQQWWLQLLSGQHPGHTLADPVAQAQTITATPPNMCALPASTAPIMRGAAATPTAPPPSASRVLPGGGVCGHDGLAELCTMHEQDATATPTALPSAACAPPGIALECHWLFEGEGTPEGGGGREAGRLPERGIIHSRALTETGAAASFVPGSALGCHWHCQGVGVLEGGGECGLGRMPGLGWAQQKSRAMTQTGVDSPREQLAELETLPAPPNVCTPAATAVAAAVLERQRAKRGLFDRYQELEGSGVCALGATAAVAGGIGSQPAGGAQGGADQGPAAAVRGRGGKDTHSGAGVARSSPGAPSLSTPGVSAGAGEGQHVERGAAEVTLEADQDHCGAAAAQQPVRPACLYHTPVFAPPLCLCFWSCLLGGGGGGCGGRHGG